MKKKTYRTPEIELLSLGIMALMAGSIKEVNSEDIDQEVSGSNEPARSKAASLWDYEWE